ncbi:MAG: hypothetical protein BWY93_00616 [Euryarchaeota archaeon ADurb.BinA087]|nr:MAG: hypothetical protein BWY93_00616 [Euryarchaeota archaeon ADurb.BinA087]
MNLPEAGSRENRGKGPLHLRVFFPLLLSYGSDDREWTITGIG